MGSEDAAAKLSLRPGEEVEVRSEQEILETLDENGALDSMPFMPEMLAFCGKRFVVEKRADKTCDTVMRTGGRRLRDSVHLKGIRCDGSFHGGCAASCRQPQGEVEGSAGVGGALRRGWSRMHAGAEGAKEKRPPCIDVRLRNC